MNDVEMFVSLISTVGFPIVCVCYMGRFANTTLKELTQTIQQNTLMIQKLYEKLGGESHEQ